MSSAPAEIYYRAPLSYSDTFSQDNFDATHYVHYAVALTPDDWPEQTPSYVGTAGNLIESVLLPGNPAQQASQGSNLFTPVNGVKGILFDGAFQSAIDGAGGVVYFEDQGTSSAGREYGFGAAAGSIGIIQFYYGDTENCYDSGHPPSGNPCQDQYAQQIYSTGGGVNITFPEVGNNPVGTAASQEYFYAAYLVPDSSPQGFLFRIYIAEPQSYALTTCNMQNGLTGAYLLGGAGSYAPCILDITIGGPASTTNSTFPLAFSATSPDFAERLFNSNGYIYILPGGATATSETADGVFANGMYVAY